MEIEGRVAVVTGAASGIGFGIAGALAAAGAEVMMADVDATRLRAKEEQLRGAGHSVAARVVDVGDQADVEALADATVEHFGGVHIVCNNAGIMRRGRAWELSLEDWEDTIRVNLLGVVHGIRAFVPRMIASGEEGHIVNTASLAAVMAVPDASPYTATKHGVLGLSEALDTELRTVGAPIGVSVLMPGLVRTRIGQPVTAPDPDPDGALQPGQMDPSEVGTRVVAGIRANTLHLFTHAGQMDLVAARFDRFTAATPDS